MYAYSAVLVVEQQSKSKYMYPVFVLSYFCPSGLILTLSQSTMVVADDGADFEDDRALMEKDHQIRRRYLQWFNKRRSDFDSDRAYDDYLETIEDVIYKLARGLDVDATKAYVEKYRAQNAEMISARQALRAEEEREAFEKVTTQETLRLRRLAQVHEEEQARENEALRRRRIADAEELVRAAHGEEEYQRVVKKREKKERKERKERRKREAAEVARTSGVPVDTQPQWYRPNFPSALPTVVGSEARDPHTRKLPEDDSAEARAGGFEPDLVQKRAELEFEQSFAALDL